MKYFEASRFILIPSAHSDAQRSVRVALQLNCGFSPTIKLTARSSERLSRP